jgi:NAD(P)-dependent dehydrogenase (short-subunit alcohol dehydrogenase family)
MGEVAITAGRMAGRAALVFGAGQGIGRGICLAMASEGATVVATDVHAENAERTAEQVRQRGAEAIGLACDVANETSVRQAVNRTLEFSDRLDFTAVTALPDMYYGPLEGCSAEHFERDWRVGVLGVLHVLKASSGPLQKSKGSVLLFGSAHGVEGSADRISYVAVKEAVRGMARAAAREWGKYGVRVNAICPFANSPVMADYERDHPDWFDDSLSQVPLHRLGDCEKDVGRAAVYLASDDGSFVTGHTLMVDGGLTMR